MKKLMILAVMLAVAAAAAIPALAQDKVQDAGKAGGDSGGSVVANTIPSSGSSEDDNLAYNADPAPADGSSEIPVPSPDGTFNSSGCSDADKISLRSAPADNGGGDSGSVIAAADPGCSYIAIEE